MYVHTCMYNYIHTAQRQTVEAHNFRVFRELHRTSKIKLREILEYRIGTRCARYSGIRDPGKLFPRNF